MRKMKRWVSLSVSLLMAVGLMAGCGGSSSSSTTSGSSATSTSSGSSSSSTVDTSKAKYTLKVGHDHTTTSPFQQCMLEFQKEVESKSNGQIKVEIYPGQQLGSAREMIEMEQNGTLEATLLPTAKFGGFDEQLNLADMPFLADTEEHFLTLMNGEVGTEAMAGLEDIGIHGVAYFPEGFKYITNNVKPITSPADLKGLKIRTMEAPIIMSMFSAWGANPVPIDFSEVYNSLQQNVVDGEENPLLSIHDMKFYEVQKYMTIDSHAYLSYFMSYSKTWFESLPSDLQTVVTDCTMSAATRCHELMTEANDGYLKDITDSGVQVYTLNDSETQAFKDACQSVYSDYRDQIGGDLLDKAVAESKKLAESSK